jgi:hypothetical protein
MKLSKKLTTVTPFSKYLAIALFIILPFVGFYLGIKYQEIKYNADKVVSYQATDPLQQAIGIVIQFENYQKARDGRKAMSLFSPPSNKAEKDWYDFIMGIDYGGKLPRLFNTSGLGYHVISYQITDVTQLEKTINIDVKETRKLWSNIAGTYTESIVSRIIEFKENNNKLLIERYYLDGNSGKTGKYDAILY